MFCNKCGKELKEGAAFCPSCGNKIIKKGTEPAIKITKDNGSIDTSKKKGLPLIGIILLGAIVLIVVLAVVAVLSSNTSKYDVDSTNTTSYDPSNYFSDIIEEEDNSGNIGISDFTVVETQQYVPVQTVPAYTEPVYVPQIETTQYVPETIPNIPPVNAVPNSQTYISPGADAAIAASADEDADDSKITIVGYEERTDPMDGCDLIINLPRVSGGEDNIAEPINNALYEACDEISEFFSKLIPMEEKTVKKINFIDARLTDAKKNVSIIMNGIMIYEDGTSKEVTATFKYSKDSETYKVTCS